MNYSLNYFDKKCNEVRPEIGGLKGAQSPNGLTALQTITILIFLVLKPPPHYKINTFFVALSIEINVVGKMFQKKTAKT